MKELYGLIGKKLGHSFSKKYFSQKFQEGNIAAQYELFELASILEFPKLWQKYPQLVGLNVTIPYKQEVIPFLDSLSPEAEGIGAVNVIKKTAEGLVGYNSDMGGFTRDLAILLGKSVPEAAFILGTGGASRAIHYSLKHKFGIKNILFVSRKPAPDLLDSPVITYDKMNAFPKNWQLVVNTTPLGMYPNIESAPQLDYEQFRIHQPSFAYDLVYNPETTLFMKSAAENGANTRGGLGMLIGQAEIAWEYWQK
jgi:shikimate dehydrogenase